MYRIIKFEKVDCAPCKQVDQLLNKLELSEHVDHVMAFDNPEFAAKFGIRSLPSIIVLDENETVIQRIVGVKPDEIKGLEKYI